MVRTLFDLAHEMQPSVVFVDEIDALSRAQQAGNAAVDANLRFEEVPSVYDDDIPF